MGRKEWDGRGEGAVGTGACVVLVVRLFESRHAQTFLERVTQVFHRIGRARSFEVGTRSQFVDDAVPAYDVTRLT